MLVRFVVAPEQIPHARKATVDTLTAWEIPDLIDDGQLVVSELLTNALRHVGDPVLMALTREENGVAVGVWDSSPDMPAPRRLDPLTLDGRGLHLVAAVSSEHGCYRSASGGKVVWARLKIGN